VWKCRQRQQQHATAAVVPCMAPAVLGRSSPRILAMGAHAPCPMIHYPLISTWSHLAVKLPFPSSVDNRHLKAVNLPILVHPDEVVAYLGDIEVVMQARRVVSLRCTPSASDLSLVCQVHVVFIRYVCWLIVDLSFLCASSICPEALSASSWYSSHL